MNLSDAQRIARGNPKIRAAVATSQKKARIGDGITDDPNCQVELFSLVKDAEAFFKAQKERLEGEGYVVTYGTVARGLYILERGEEAVSSSFVKRQTTRTGDRPSGGSS